MEQSPWPHESGYELKLNRYDELPHYYQCLGKACAAAGLNQEFHAVVQAGMDYGQAVSALRHDLEQKLEASNLDVWLEHFGVPSGFDEPEVE